MDDLARSRERSSASAPSSDILRCPICLDSLPLDQHAPDWTGVIPCRCGENPVVCGVVVPRATGLDDAMLAAAQRGDVAAARSLLIGKFEKRLRRQEQKGEAPTFRNFLRHGALANAFETRPGRWLAERFAQNSKVHKLSAAALFYHYMRFRFSTPSHRAALPLLWMLDPGPQGEVLDAACGMGHLAFEIAKVCGENRLVCADFNGAHAFSARKFFVPNALAVVKTDLGKPWPMPDARFSAVFCSDALPYIEDKTMAAAEMMRVLRDDGFLALPHLYNGLSPSALAQGAWSPSQYAGLFSGHDVRLFPESHFASAQQENRPIDLSARFSNDSLRSSQALVLIAAKSDKVFRVYPPTQLTGSLIPQRVEVCEFYKRRQGPGGLHLSREIPKRFLKFHQELLDFLPERVDFNERDLHDGNAARCQDLLKRGVFVEVPNAY